MVIRFYLLRNQEIFLSSQIARPHSGAHPASYSVGTKDFLPRGILAKDKSIEWDWSC